MNNCIISARFCEEEFNSFVKNIVVGLGRVEARFVAQMLTGINAASSVLLTEIARNSIKGVSIKKSTERLSRLLNRFNANTVWDNYCNEVSPLLGDRRLYIMDDTDVAKPLSKRMEGLSRVHDGSKGKIENGYFVNEIVAINKKGQPVSVSSKLYTSREADFKSVNGIRAEAVTEVIKTNGSGIFVCDRGFDDVKLYNFLTKLNQGFVVRCRKNRDVIDSGQRINIHESAKNLKGKYAFSIKFQKGAKQGLKASYKQVQLPKMKHPVNLVVVYGFHLDDNEPFYLLTNLPINDKETCINAVRVYLTRWKIEEYFKFKKQAYRFEKMRLLKLSALKNLNTLLTIVLGFISMLSLSRIAKRLIFLSEPIRKKATFIYYRLHLGLRTVLHNLKQDLMQMLFPKRKPKQLIPKQRDFFHYLRYEKRYEKV